MSAIGYNSAASTYLDYMFCGAIVHKNSRVDVVYTDDKGSETLSMKGFFTKGVDTMSGFGTPTHAPKLSFMHTCSQMTAAAQVAVPGGQVVRAQPAGLATSGSAVPEPAVPAVQ